MTAGPLVLRRRASTVAISGRRAAELAREAGLKPIYSHPARGWLIDLRRLPDLVAHLEHSGIRHRYVEEGA